LSKVVEQSVSVVRNLSCALQLLYTLVRERDATWSRMRAFIMAMRARS
jgi:hypothetical protein